MNILSLFDGMSCGQIALQKLGVEVENYYASEIDKPAIQVTKHNFPNTQHLGDVAKWKEWGIDWGSIDLILAGSPCQGFSFAGKQLAFDDPRSKLFFTFVDILNHIKSVNPKVKFLLENVRMKKQHRDVISELLGVKQVEICSSLVSAQQRKRFYWANWRFNQPKDKGIFLSDIVDFQDKIFLNPKTQTRPRTIQQIKSMDQKALCLLASMGKGSQSNGMTNIKLDGQIRCVSPTECERLQTVPDGYTKILPKTHRYHVLGNGWTVDVVAHILKPMIQERILGDLF